MVAEAADDHGREQHDRLGVAPRLRVPEVDEADEDAAREPCDRSTDHHRGGAQLAQVLAKRVGDDVVVAHRAQRPAVRRVRDAPDEQVDGEGDDHCDRRIAPLVAAREWVDRALQRRGHERQPGRAVEERHVVVDQQVEHDRGREQADGGEVAAQPPADDRGERHRQQSADQRGADPRQRERQVQPTDVGLEAAVGAVGR